VCESDLIYYYGTHNRLISFFYLDAEKRNSKVFSDDRANTTFKALQQRRSTVLHRKSSVVDIRRKSQAFEDAESRAGSVRSMAPSTSSSVGLEGDGRRQFRRNKSKSPHRTRSNASRVSF